MQGNRREDRRCHAHHRRRHTLDIIDQLSTCHFVIFRVVFAIERDLPPIDAMFLYRILDWTGDIGDRAQRVGSRLQLMLAR